MADDATDDLTTEHGAIMTAKWDWTTASSTNRWSTPQQAVKPRRFYIPTSSTTPRNDGFGVLRTRLKIRGKGDALVVRYESEEGKDFQLLGFGIPITVEMDT